MSEFLAHSNLPNVRTFKINGCIYGVIISKGNMKVLQHILFYKINNFPVIGRFQNQNLHNDFDFQKKVLYYVRRRSGIPIFRCDKYNFIPFSRLGMPRFRFLIQFIV